jgi:hypothetical protein
MEFTPKGKGCKPCVSIRSKNWYINNRGKRLRYYQAHRDHTIEWHKKYVVIVKEVILTHYGNGKLACVKCGFDDIRALSIDHIDGRGAEHKRSLGISGSLHSWLLKNHFPEGYQTLCMNCQFIKRYENKELYKKENKIN